LVSGIACGIKKNSDIFSVYDPPPSPPPPPPDPWDTRGFPQQISANLVLLVSYS